MAEAAAADSLIDPFKYQDIIDKFAQRYGLHPDDVFNTTEFGTITGMLVKWMREGEYQDIYNELERIGSQIPQPK
jgi:hypothetical protein